MAKPDRCPTCNQKIPQRKTSKFPGVHQRGDGMWVGVVELPARDGKRRRKPVVRKTEKAAAKARADLLDQLARNGDIHTETMTVDTWFRYWLDQIIVKQVAPATYESYANHALNHFIPYFGATTRVAKITPAKVRGLERAYLDKGLSSASASAGFAVLRRSLRDAHREGRIESNPCQMVDPPRIRAVERDALTVEEAITVLQHAAPLRLGPAFAIAILTGARRNEILGLERDRITDHLDFSWQLKHLRVDEHGEPIAPADYETRRLPMRESDGPAASARYFLARPKSKAGWRIVPLVEPLRSILERHLANPDTPADGLVFRGVKGGPVPEDSFTAAWKRLLKSAGVNENVVLHGARHTTVDLLYMAGVPEDLIQEIVGHSTRGMTRAYKSKGNTARLTEAMQRMSALVTPKQLES